MLLLIENDRWKLLNRSAISFRIASVIIRLKKRKIVSKCTQIVKLFLRINIVRNIHFKSGSVSFGYTLNT